MSSFFEGRSLNMGPRSIERWRIIFSFFDLVRYDRSRDRQFSSFKDQIYDVMNGIDGWFRIIYPPY